MTAAATDFSQYQRMRLDADSRDPAVLREVAGQFEALFLEILLKDMRNASLGDPIFGQSNQHDLYREMLDQPFAVEMSSGRGIGIADMLAAQLGGEHPVERPTAGRGEAVPAITGVTQVPAMRSPSSAPLQNDVLPATPTTGRWSEPTDFARDVWPHAERAGQALGIAPQSLVAQAALETGWGSRVITRPDGSSSLNLFGSVAQTTLEYRTGVAQRETARFRAYPDLAAAFDDYVAFIGGKSRYAGVPGNGDDARAFGNALQQAGYATDPAYAEKIARVAGGETMQEILAALRAGTDTPATRQQVLAALEPGVNPSASSQTVLPALKPDGDLPIDSPIDLPVNTLRSSTTGTWPRN